MKCLLSNAGAAEGRKKWGSNTAMASAGARAYNGGLLPVESQGAKPPEADEVLVFKTPIFNASATVLHEILHCLSCFFCKVSK